MLTLCWAPKGGSGTTVVVAALAVASRQPTLVVDLTGDLPAVFGVPEPEGPGVVDWARSAAGPERLRALAIEVFDHVHLLPHGSPGDLAPGRVGELASWLSAHEHRVVIDAGSGRAPHADLLAASDRALLVTRLCYLSLRAAVRQRACPTGVVVLREPGRALRLADVEASLGAPVVAQLHVDPGVARAVDSGLLAARLPAGYRQALTWAA